MSAHKLVVKHISGESYKIQLPRENIAQMSLTPKSFWDEGSARQFVNSLSVTNDFWLDIINQCGPLSGTQLSTSGDIEKQVSHLMVRDQLKFYPVNILDTVEHPPEKRVLKCSNNILYRFEPSSTLLFTSASETKKFKNSDKAKDFLTELSSDNEKLTTIAKELNIDIPTTALVNESETAEAISQALASGQVVVIVDKTSSVPATKKEVEIQHDTNNKKASDEVPPPAAENTEVQDKEKPKCIYQEIKLTCRHDRSVTLDPVNPPIDGKITRLQIVSSQVENLKDKNNPVFEILTVNTKIEDVCPSHQTDFISINDSDVKLIGPQINGELVKFKSPSKALLGNNYRSLLKYLWLPNVEADGVKHYKVSAKKICDFSKFDGKTKSIQVDVYPFMKWSLNFNVNLGSIKNDNKPSTNKIAFGGSLKLQQDNQKTDEFSADYKEKLDIFEQTLDSFKKIITDNILNKFIDGRDLLIDVTLPKISLGYDSQFKENPNSNLVVRTHEFNFEAAPFIKINCSVDILPIIVSYLSSWWARPFNAFFGWVKQTYGEVAGKKKIQAGISFKVSIEGELEAKFTHKQDENERTSIEGEPVKSKITIKAEGEAKMDGHIYVVKIEVVLKAGVESSIELGLSVSSDDLNSNDNTKKSNDNAPYVSLYFMFNGVKVYLEKEIQISLDKSIANEVGGSKDDDMFDNAPDVEPVESTEGSVKESERLERVWLKMSDKHQFKYYLNKEDREEIKNMKALEK